MKKVIQATKNKNLNIGGGPRKHKGHMAQWAVFGLDFITAGSKLWKSTLL